VEAAGRAEFSLAPVFCSTRQASEPFAYFLSGSFLLPAPNLAPAARSSFEKDYAELCTSEKALTIRCTNEVFKALGLTDRFEKCQAKSKRYL